VSVADSVTGDTREGRDLYQQTAARWAAVFEWWDRDPGRQGLPFLSVPFDKWRAVDKGIDATKVGALHSLMEDLEAAEVYAHDKGYPAKSWPAVDWSALENRGAAAARDLGDAADRAGQALKGALPNIPKSPRDLLPPWWFFAGGAAVFVGIGVAIYNVAKVGAKVAPYVGPIVAPEAMPLWLAMQRAQGAQGASAPAQAPDPAWLTSVPSQQAIAPQVVESRREDEIATRIAGLAQIANAFGLKATAPFSAPPSGGVTFSSQATRVSR